MHKSELHSLISRQLGNHHRRSDVLQVLSFPGLSVDNATVTPIHTSAGVLGQSVPGGATEVSQQVAALSKNLTDLKTVQQSQLDKLNENTQALHQNTSAKSAGGRSTAGSIGSAASSIFGGVLGLAPIFKGIFDLFSGSKSQAVQPPTPFNLPPSIQYAGGVGQSDGRVTPVDYGQNGLARPLNGAGGSSGPQAAQTVQINVNAMDSRSFLDHSEDIARAVRHAMLHSNALNDLIADL